MRIRILITIISLLCLIPNTIRAKDNQIYLSVVFSFESSGSISVPAEGGEVSLFFMVLRPMSYDLLMDHLNDAFSGSEDTFTSISVSGYSGNIEGTLTLEIAANDDEERVITLFSSQNSVDIIQDACISSVFTLSANKTQIMHGEDISFTLNGSTSSFRYELFRDGISVDRKYGDGSSITFHATGAGTYTAESTRPSVIQMNGSVLITYLPFYTYSHSFSNKELVADRDGGVYRVRFEKNSSASDSEFARIITFYNGGACSEWNKDIRVDYLQDELVFSCGPNMGSSTILNNTWFRNNSSNYLTIRQPNGGELKHFKVSSSNDGSSIMVSGSQPFVEYRLLKDGERTSSISIGTGSPIFFSQFSGAGEYSVEASYKGHHLTMPGTVSVLSNGSFMNTNENWIIQETCIEPTGLVNPIRDITYYNGLGDPEQIINVAASPQGRNIVTPIWYDMVRRADVKVLLPYVSFKSRADKEEDPIMSQQAYYSSLYGDNEGEYAYEEKVYSTSPSNRILSQKKPGEIYRAMGKEVSFSYDSNSSDSVLRIDWDAEDGGIHVCGFYPAGLLFAQSTEDEDGKVVINYKDKLDRLVLSRAVSGDLTQDTYYVYDGLSQLRWVIQPEGSNLLQSQTSWTIDSPEAQNYAFRYTYNGRGRITETRLPGKEVEYTIYDPAGRPVAHQDGNLRAQGRWVLVKYTPFGEEDSKYITRAGSFTKHFLEAAFNDDVFPSYVYSNSRNILIEQNVYDSYPTWALSPENDSSMDLVESPKGLLTGKEVADLSTIESSTVNYLRSSFYYDKRGLLRQVVSLFPEGITYDESMEYDYLGNIIRKKSIVSGDNVERRVLEETASYDNRGRLIASSASIRNSTATVIYEYDDLGRVIAKTLGDVTQKDEYNLQGWMTKRTAEVGITPIYTQALRYYSPLLGNDAQYGGNISEWMVENGNTSGTYGFSYDGFGRLTSSLHFANKVISGKVIRKELNGKIDLTPVPAPYKEILPSGDYAFTERDITYDKNGNILSLKRYGRSAIIPQEDLLFSYNGNQLSSISGSTTALYQYDVNGNLLIDGENHYSFTYDLLNRVNKVFERDRLKADYHSFADGTKYKTLDGNGSGLIYIGPFVYTHSGFFESVSACGGDVRFMCEARTISPFYYITDHLGSVRVIADEGGNVVERNDYYPYGTKHSYGTRYPSLETNRQKFSGKEDQSFVGLNVYDFGARMYSAADARWTTMDPLSEKYYHISPYAYCAGNPVNLVDPDGRTIVVRRASDDGTLCEYEWRQEDDLWGFYDSDNNAYSGDDSYILSLTNALNDLMDGASGGDLVKELVDSEERIFVDKSDRFDNSYFPSSNTVCWNPGGSRIGSDFVAFGHELAHALDDINGTYNTNTWISKEQIPGLGKDITYAEVFATHWENKIRQEHGIPLRTAYVMDASGNYIGPRIIDRKGRSLYFNLTGDTNNYKRINIFKSKQRYKY